MKKITHIVISLLLMVSYSYGQGEVEANQFSRTDLYGTARAISMGGAFGALGGDLTGVSINPAGIAVYRSSEIATTAVLQSNKFKADNETNSKNKFNFHNLGFVGYFPTRNEMMPVVNFGFSYNKVKSFDREIGAVGTNRNKSLADFMAADSKGIHKDDLSFFDDEEGKYDPFLSDISWLSTLGYQSYLMNADGDNKYKALQHGGGGIEISLYLSERGSIDVYDFTVGTSINNVLNLGVSLSVTDMYYDVYSENREDLPKVGNNFMLTNIVEKEGSGLGVKLGVIYRPIHQLRLGLSYHSPTWYEMSEYYAAIVDHDIADYAADGYKVGFVDSRDDNRGYLSDKYKFKSPDKWTASAALVMGTNMIISMDYELTDYGSMKYSNSYASEKGRFDFVNSRVKSDYKNSSAVRAGLEYRFTPQLSGRLGYAWMQNPYDKSFVEYGDPSVIDARTGFVIEGDANYFTGGLGYRFNRYFYLDFALVYKTQKDDLYAMPNVYDINLAPYKLTNNTIKGLLTLGYKF